PYGKELVPPDEKESLPRPPPPGSSISWWRQISSARSCRSSTRYLLRASIGIMPHDVIDVVLAHGELVQLLQVRLPSDQPRGRIGRHGRVVVDLPRRNGRIFGVRVVAVVLADLSRHAVLENL